MYTYLTLQVGQILCTITCPVLGLKYSSLLDMQPKLHVFTYKYIVPSGIHVVIRMYATNFNQGWSNSDSYLPGLLWIVKFG